jgi:isoamylase
MQPLLDHPPSKVKDEHCQPVITSNAYYQNNELTWFEWNAAEQHKDLVDFHRRLCRFREAHPRCSGAASSSTARPAPDATRDDLDWYHPDGNAMPAPLERWR